MSDPTPLDYWTLSIAIIGAVTGVAALAVTVWGTVLAGPRVKVTVANAYTTATDEWWLSVDASNIGRLPVTILDVGITFRASGMWKQAPVAAMRPESWRGTPPPHRLPDAEAVTWLIDPDPLAASLALEHSVRNVHGYVRLATGTTIRSRNKIDIANLASLN
ncbi:hypothetical protein H5398_15465 [Tessaracoccus sp. MC1679]|uniref:hypothetical protein n=1 Tax=Tessaracoccus sp. MC1679 TaxID=2760313 RepID=UPI001601BCCF|nr:hypothetical protein [Tessaracoccus sp. MC1679]MBB1517353.1 hypothetical protein [Tessaracoccus sp. MC1679]